MAANSSAIHPAPQPTVTRPPLSTSMLASILAVSTGGRCGTTITELSMRIREVAPARNAISESCSNHLPESAPAILRLSA